jgi:hypothetical protein
MWCVKCNKKLINGLGNTPYYIITKIRCDMATKGEIYYLCAPCEKTRMEEEMYNKQAAEE